MTFASIPPDTIHFAAPESTAKAPPFETGATVRSPMKEYEMQRNPMLTVSFLLNGGDSVTIQSPPEEKISHKPIQNSGEAIFLGLALFPGALCILPGHWEHLVSFRFCPRPVTTIHYPSARNILPCTSSATCVPGS